MKRYLYLFPLMAFTAATLTLAACDENKSEETATAEQTVEETATPDVAAAPAPAPAALMHAEGANSYATAPQSTVGAIFLTLHNPQMQADKLIGATTDVAGSVEMHENVVDANGVMQMRKVDSIEIQPGQQIDLKPGGHHLMLMGLKAPLTSGSEFPVTLDFETAPDVTLQVMVRDAAAEIPAAPMQTMTVPADPVAPAGSGAATTPQGAITPDTTMTTPTDEPVMPSEEATPEPTTMPEGAISAEPPVNEQPAQ